MMTHDEMIAVIHAHKDGRHIQFQKKDLSFCDVPDNRPYWNFANEIYRVKPEPRSLWVVKDDDDSVYDTLEVESEALGYLVDNPTWTITEYKEVIKP